MELPSGKAPELHKRIHRDVKCPSGLLIEFQGPACKKCRIFRQNRLLPAGPGIQTAHFTVFPAGRQKRVQPVDFGNRFFHGLLCSLPICLKRHICIHCKYIPRCFFPVAFRKYRHAKSCDQYNGHRGIKPAGPLFQNHGSFLSSLCRPRRGRNCRRRVTVQCCPLSSRICSNSASGTGLEK